MPVTEGFVCWTEPIGTVGPCQYITNRLGCIDIAARAGSITKPADAVITQGNALGIYDGINSYIYSVCPQVSPTPTTTTTVAPITLTLTASCIGSGINGTGRIVANGFGGGTGTFANIKIGNSLSNAAAATPILLSGATSYTWNNLVNSIWFVILTDNAGNSNYAQVTVNCTNTTTTTSTSTTTTAAPDCNFNGGTAVIIYPTTTSTTSTSTTSTTSTSTTSTSTTTSAPTTTSTTTSGYVSFSLTYSNTAGETACTDYSNPMNRVTYYASPGSTLTTGTILYTTTALNTPVANGYYSNGSNYWNTAASAGNLQNQTLCGGATSTTTTTTTGPGGSFTIYNTAGSGQIDDVNTTGGAYFYFFNNGSFPITTGQQADAGGASLTNGPIYVQLSNNFSTTCMTLTINGIEFGTLYVAGPGQYTFSNVTLSTSDTVVLEYGTTNCL